MSEALHPTLGKERIKSLDILRGIAILGILIMNIQSFAMPGAAYLNPTAYGDFEGMNYWVWVLGHIFADQKFITIFSILFGAGIVLVTQKAEERDGKSAGLHYKRNFWLLVIGLLHAHLLWYGDILVAYAIGGFFVYLFRKMKPRTLIIIGTLLFSVHTFIYLLFGASVPHLPEEAALEISQTWIPTSVQIQEEIDAITGSLSEQISYVSESALTMETMVFAILMFWKTSGLMLIGMALFKMGVLSGLKSSLYYKKGILWGVVLGIPLIIYGLIQNQNAGFSFEYSMFIGSQFNYWGSLFLSFSYICGIMLFANSERFMNIKAQFAAVGRMALTNYIAQSLLGVFIFFGIGLGLFGEFSRLEQAGIVLGIWLIQIAWSKPWLEKFKFGPLEWVWRSLTYGKIQSMKKNTEST